MRPFAVIAINLLLLLAFVSTASAQGRWDVDKDTPPPTDNAKPLPKPTKLKPFTFMFYEVCDSPNIPRLTDSRYWFEIMSRYTMVAFEHKESDSEVVLTLGGWKQFGQTGKIRFPMKPFALRVILNDDTAAFRMDLSSGEWTYVDMSALLTVEAPKVLPSDLVRMQFRSRDNDRARDFLKHADAQFGAAVEPYLLAKGFYPCLPTQVVERTNIGRGKVVNETAWGFLICLRVVDRSRSAEVAQWVSEQERVEAERER